MLAVLVRIKDDTWFTMYFSSASRKYAVRSSWFLSPDCGGTRGVISSGVTWTAGGEAGGLNAYNETHNRTNKNL